MKNQGERDFKKNSTRAEKCHAEHGVELTMHIDEALLKRVVDDYGYESKTQAVEMAMHELGHKTRFRRLGTEGSGLTHEEWENAIFPRYNPKNLVIHNPLSSKVAEESPRDGKRNPDR